MSDIKSEIVGQNQTPTSSEGGFNIDFGALRQKASEMMDKVEEQSEAPAPQSAQAEKPVTQQVEKPAVETPKADEGITSTPKFLELKPDQLVKVIVDGEEQLLPWKDASSKIS